MVRPFERRGYEARGDDARLEQTEIVVAEIEQVPQVGHVLGGAQVYAGQTQQWLGDNPDIGFDGRPRTAVASVYAQVNRDVQNARALGIVHAQKKDIRPAAVAEIKADRRCLCQDGIEPFAGFETHHLGVDAQGMVHGVSHAEHPLVAPACAHAASHLVAQRLKGQVMIGFGQCAEERARRPVPFDGVEKAVNGFLEAAFEQISKTCIGDGPCGGEIIVVLGIKAVDCVEEQGGAYAFVQVG